MMDAIYTFLVFMVVCTPLVRGNLEQGRFGYDFSTVTNSFIVAKTMFADTNIFVAITCDTYNYTGTKINIAWKMKQTQCYADLMVDNGDRSKSKNDSFEIRPPIVADKCAAHIILPEFRFNESSKTDLRAPNEKFKNSRVFTVTKDGLYTFSLEINSNGYFTAHAEIEIKAVYGYLSASDWPLLPFYGTMCLVYVISGIVWLTLSFLQWRDLLRIQFWIGGVIFLGMLEKAVFYAEYQNVNSTGVSVQGAELVAEWVSCAKRTLARMLVIIVSLGFGIVKPRLGPMLHRVVGIGFLYFSLACVEGYLRVIHVKHDQNNQTLLAGIPLAVLDSAICWWIFTSLVQTTRTLRLRRHVSAFKLLFEKGTEDGNTEIRSERYHRQSLSEKSTNIRKN